MVVVVVVVVVVVTGSRARGGCVVVEVGVVADLGAEVRLRF